MRLSNGNNIKLVNTNGVILYVLVTTYTDIGESICEEYIGFESKHSYI